MRTLYNIFDFRYPVHIAHFRMAVQLYTLFRVEILSLHGEVTDFPDSAHRTDGQLPVKFVDRGNPLYFQECTLFYVAKQVRELVVSGKHLDNDRIGKIGDGKHEDRLFIPDLSRIKADDLSPDGDLAHLTQHLGEF